MRHAILVASLMLVCTGLAKAGNEQPTCAEPVLKNAQVKAIVDRERAAQSDFFPAYPKYDWVVRRRGCHYVYTEYGIPATPDYSQSITLNQKGVIVDADDGRLTPPGPKKSDDRLRCPEKTLEEKELKTIVARERAHRPELPQPFPEITTRVERLRCLYMYYEYAQPPVPGKYQVFIIDPFGEFMEFSRGAAARVP